MPRSRSNIISGWGINDADYVVKEQEDFYLDGVRKRKLLWECPYYKTWKGMIMRCFSDKLKEKHTSCKYSNACEEWRYFSKFKAWMEQQDWEGKCLDKDLLVRGNKTYSPETCCFVNPLTNTFINEQEGKRGNLALGVVFCKHTSKFVARVSDPFTGKRVSIGYFSEEIEAKSAYLIAKQNLARKVADLETNPLVKAALIGRYKEKE